MFVQMTKEAVLHNFGYRHKVGNNLKLINWIMCKFVRMAFYRQQCRE